MIRRLILLIIPTFAVCGVLRAIDLNTVAVNVRMHPGSYNTLLERFQQADTTLTPDEISTLYYGYPFTPRFDSSETWPEVTRAYETGNYELALRLATQALEEAPLSLNLSVIALASADRLRAAGKPAPQTYRLGMRCDLIATAILESGNGTSPHSPFLVTDPADIDRILHNVLGIDSIVDRTKVGHVLALKVTFPGSARRHILYFDNAAPAPNI